MYLIIIYSDTSDTLYKNKGYKVIKSITYEVSKLFACLDIV